MATEASKKQDERIHHMGSEREFETGKDESWFGDNISNSKAWHANVKRTYDEYQHESLESIRRNRLHIDKLISDAQQFDNQRQVIANQALQNAVETANLTAKQSVRHTDLATDRHWNVDEQGYTAQQILNDATFQDAIAAAVAKAVQEVSEKIKK